MTWEVIALPSGGVYIFTEEDEKHINLVPDYGTEHDLFPGCWCAPEIKYGGLVLIHNPDH